MASGKYVSYFRVSTARQGQSGLGIEAQRAAVAEFLNGGRWKVVGEFVEIESGKKDDRPQLAAALAACRVHGAKLCIAKLDRLSRDACFLLSLEKAGVDFVCADMPSANRLTIGIMAMVAEEERRMISARTKAALAAAKARGTKLGGLRYRKSDKTVVKITPEAAAASLEARQARAEARARDLAPTLAAMKAEGITSLREIAKALTARGVPAARGGSNWSPSQVSRVLARIE
jgi:DNA invertase Pin-like site-specific DNA recombinase